MRFFFERPFFVLFRLERATTLSPPYVGHKRKPKEKTQKLLEHNSTVSAAVETVRHRENAASLFVSSTLKKQSAAFLSVKSLVSHNRCFDLLKPSKFLNLLP
jgi:hypothetical protein